jgi:hypothetical protein
MSKPKKSIIEVRGTAVTVLSTKDEDFISLTDMLKAKDGDFFISDWLRNRNTVEFLGIWESVHNPGFNSGEFAIIKSQAGLNYHRTIARAGQPRRYERRVHPHGPAPARTAQAA